MTQLVRQVVAQQETNLKDLESTPLIRVIAELTQVLNEIPALYRATAAFDFSGTDPDATYSIVYSRLETEEEVRKREEREARHSADKRTRDLAYIKVLKKLYPEEFK